MKLYGDFSKRDWQKVLGIPEVRIPASFIIHGEYNHTENLRLWQEILREELLKPKWNTILGKYHQADIGFSNVFGSSMAAMMTHQFASAGTEHFIQTGYISGLSLRIEYGDILIVNEAEMADGVSNLYLPEQEFVQSDEDLLYETINYCEQKKYKYVTGSVLTTSAILLETRDLVSEWAARGHIGVDMETAATLSVAKKLNKKAIGILNLSGHLIKGDTFYFDTEERGAIQMETDEKIRDIALFLTKTAKVYE